MKYQNLDIWYKVLANVLSLSLYLQIRNKALLPAGQYESFIIYFTEKFYCWVSLSIVLHA